MIEVKMIHEEVKNTFEYKVGYNDGREDTIKKFKQALKAECKKHIFRRKWIERIYIEIIEKASESE